jgi:hypothetical protein
MPQMRIKSSKRIAGTLLYPPPVRGGGEGVIAGLVPDSNTLGEEAVLFRNKLELPVVVGGPVTPP